MEAYQRPLVSGTSIHGNKQAENYIIALSQILSTL